MYDLAGRLTNVSKDDAPVSQYVYDANGNRLSYIGAGGTISGTYDNQDRLMQYGTTLYTYTANGELLSKTTEYLIRHKGKRSSYLERVLRLRKRI